MQLAEISKTFNRDKVLIFENYLNSDICEDLASIRDKLLVPTNHTSSKSLINHTPSLINLIFESKIINIIRSIMGNNIKLSYFELLSTPPEANINDDFLGYSSTSGLGIHQDGAFINHDVKSNSPMLSLKLGIPLNKNKNSNRANFVYSTNKPKSINEMNETQLKLGDIIIFDRRLFHARTMNSSNETRYFLYFEFSFRWIKTKFIFKPNEKLLSLLSNSQKAVLGLNTEEYWDLYWPSKKTKELLNE